MADKVPTDEEVTKARDTIARAAFATAEEPRKAVIDLVTSKAYAEVEDGFRKAFQLNPADTDIAYTVSMMARIRGTYTPA